MEGVELWVPYASLIAGAPEVPKRVGITITRQHLTDMHPDEKPGAS